MLNMQKCMPCGELHRNGVQRVHQLAGCTDVPSVPSVRFHPRRIHRGSVQGHWVFFHQQNLLEMLVSTGLHVQDTVFKVCVCVCVCVCLRVCVKRLNGMTLPWTDTLCAFSGCRDRTSNHICINSDGFIYPPQTEGGSNASQTTTRPMQTNLHTGTLAETSVFTTSTPQPVPRNTAGDGSGMAWVFSVVALFIAIMLCVGFTK